MDEPMEPRYFCPVCQTGFSEEAIDEGAAIKRYNEVYCREHFREKFPDECIDHPGTLVSAQCSRCGRRVCENCYIELRGKKICGRCKPARMVEMVTGRPARRVEKRYWGPARIARGLVDRFRARRREMVRREWPIERVSRGKKLLFFVSLHLLLLTLIMVGRSGILHRSPAPTRVNGSQKIRYREKASPSEELLQREKNRERYKEVEKLRRAAEEAFARGDREEAERLLKEAYRLILRYPPLPDDGLSRPPVRTPQPPEPRSDLPQHKTQLPDPNRECDDGTGTLPKPRDEPKGH